MNRRCGGKGCRAGRDRESDYVFWGGGVGGRSRAEYRLVDWETGEIQAVYHAADNSVFACVSRDGSLAAAFEDILQESFYCS